MNMKKHDHQYLKDVCKKRRLELIELLHKFQTGHPGGSLSAVEIITLLYYETMDVEKIKRKESDRDRFILGKGHAAPVLYLTLADLGFFPKSDMETFRQIGSNLQGHPCADKTQGVEVSTGPLGLGLSAGVGIALSAKMDKLDYTTYVLMGDGELQEGIIWESAMAAAKYNLGNLVAIVDHNGVQLDGTLEEVMPLGNLCDKWRSFGWEVFSAKGHDLMSLSEALDNAKKSRGKPSVIIADTVKGKGVSFMEGKKQWHGRQIDGSSYKKAIEELEAKV